MFSFLPFLPLRLPAPNLIQVVPFYVNLVPLEEVTTYMWRIQNLSFGKSTTGLLLDRAFMEDIPSELGITTIGRT